MTNKEFTKMMMNCIHEAQRASCGKTFVLKPKTLVKLDRMTRSAEGDCQVSFDAAFNAIDISVKKYVFDSQCESLKEMILCADIIVIDSESDGKVCIELRILNAANILKGVE